MGKRSAVVRSVVVVAVAVVMAAGCASPASTGGPASGAQDPPVAVPDAPLATPTPTSSPRGWPAGADADTPDCQDASAAVVAAANAALRAESAARGVEAADLPWLSAHADADLGAWTLTGVTSYDASSGFFVVLATREDPTSASFAGELFSVGGSAQSTTGLPVLQPGYVAEDPMDDVPGSALGCAETRQQQP